MISFQLNTTVRSTSQVYDQRQNIDVRIKKLEQTLAFVEKQRVVRAGVALREDLLSLSRIINKLPGTTQTNSDGAAVAVGSSPINLDTTPSAASLTSVEEVNSETTSYDATQADWVGASSADPQVSGFYNGDQGTGQLSFTVTQAGVRGTTQARIAVRGPDAVQITEFVVESGDPIATQYAVGNGLQVEFGSGVFVIGDTFTVDVEAGLDRQVDPGAAFDSPGAGPNFDNGVSVTAGAFTINGTTINVLSDDSISSVLAKISSSGAGVNASYDSATETVQFIQKNQGAQFDIGLGSDSSGFLAAVKLDAAVLVPGTTSEADLPLEEVAQFSGVSAGSILINGVGIAIDPSADRLADVMQRINASGAGVSIELTANALILIRAMSGELDIDDNGTGLFLALNVDSKTYAFAQSTQGPPDVLVRQTARETRGVIDKLNQLFVTPFGSKELAEISELRSQVDAVLGEELVASLQALGLQTGFKNGNVNAQLAYTNLREDPLVRGFKSQFSQVLPIFKGTSEKNGFVENLLEALDETLRQLRQPGLLIDEEV